MANTDTPPWGSDDEFDAAKAWALIQGLRTDKAKLTDSLGEVTTARDALQSQVDEAANAGKSDADKAKADADKVAADLTAARRELYIERALRKHEVPEELAEFLTGDDEESILAKAAKLAGLGKPADADADAKAAADKAAADAAAAAADTSKRPTPSLTPGHGGDDPAPFDADAIAAAIRG